MTVSKYCNTVCFGYGTQILRKHKCSDYGRVPIGSQSCIILKFDDFDGIFIINNATNKND